MYSGLKSDKCTSQKTESTQQKKAKIIGVVTDSKTGEPIIGATVQLLGTTTGVITDVDKS